MNRDRLLERFLRYVRIDTTAREGVDEYPSSAGQWELGRIVLGELKTMGLADAAQDEHAIVIATLPANGSRSKLQESSPVVVAFNAHFDTSPETTGAGVRPRVIEKYDGRDLVLPGDPRQVLLAAGNPELAAAIGKTVITTDGTTLLGGDDKAGIAVIMELIEHLVEHPEVPRPTIKVCFTCDEEIGRGVDHVDIAKLGATVCYTLDGRGAGELDVETFSADLATVTVRGVNIHPSMAKGRMVNAIRAAADFVERLAARNTVAGSDGGSRGLFASVSCRWRSRRGADARVAARFRHRGAGDASRIAARGGGANRRGVSRRGDRRADQAAVSQHGRRTGPRTARRAICRTGIPAARPAGAENDYPRRDRRLALHGARAARRRIFRRASTIRIRRWNGHVWRKWSMRWRCWSS